MLMTQRNTAVLVILLLGLLAIVAWQALNAPSPAGPAVIEEVGRGDSPEAIEASAEAAAAATTSEALDGQRSSLPATDLKNTGVRGRVIDGRSRGPLAGVEVVALRRPPSIERLVSRFRGLFQRGLWTETHSPPEILGSAVTDGDGRFEILGLPRGTVFLDGRSEVAFVRTPRAARLADGEILEGVELVGEPGGSLRGVVLAPDGMPASGASVSLRPGINAFLGQLTQRKLRWLETNTDSEGRFNILGVPTGDGYTVSAVHPLMALEEVYGVAIEEGRTTDLTVQGQAGAAIVGRVVAPDGTGVPGANIAMVYLDISRALLSADGREEPWTTDADGSFRIDRIAAGHVAIAAVADGLGPSQIQQLTVVDGGEYDEVTLALEAGVEFGGLVVDEQGRPLPGAVVELRPFERPNDPNVIQMALKIRTVRVETGADGSFLASGMSGQRLVLQASKPGYVSEVRFGVKLEEHPRIQLVRGATVRGVVMLEDETPCRRFAVQTRSRANNAANRSENPSENSSENPSENRSGWRNRSGEDGGRRGRWGGGRSRTMRIAEGQELGDGGGRGQWREVLSDDGTFELTGVPPGKVRVRVRAEGSVSPDEQSVELDSGAVSEVLRFSLRAGIEVRGSVVDAATGVGVPGAQVTAHRVRDRGGFRFNIEAEDFDFLGLSANFSGRSAHTDSQGRFAVPTVSPGEYQFTARHPDLAKASSTKVAVESGSPTPDVLIELSPGGAVEGYVTGAGGLPLVNAVVAAFSLSAGALKSATTNTAGYYNIAGLSPGQYMVFKSRMDERAPNIGYELLGNMRLKTASVRAGKVARLDIHDAEAGTVRVYGVVRDGDEPVGRAMVGALSSDSDGIFGMGIRAKPTDEQGRYELIGMKPGDYLFQVTRFRDRPQQANLSIEIPEGVAEYRIDLDLPQSYIEGIVQDSTGQPVPGIQVQAGVEEGGASEAGGLLGLMLKNSVGRARTDETGHFKMKGVAPGVYRLTASGRERRRRDDGPSYGDTSLSDVMIDGTTPLTGVVLTLPLAGRITGRVVDGNGAPVVGAQIHYQREGAKREKRDALADLFGMQIRPSRSDEQGQFTLKRVSPGTYSVRAEVEGKAPGVAEDVIVVESGTTDVNLKIVVGAKLAVRVTNIDGTILPAARVTVLDGSGKPLARQVSVFSVFRRVMGGRQKKDDSGWYEIGNVPPDTYTIIVSEEGQPDISVTRTIRDGEELRWEIDMTAEIESRGRARKK